MRIKLNNAILTRDNDNLIWVVVTKDNQKFFCSSSLEALSVLVEHIDPDIDDNQYLSEWFNRWVDVIGQLTEKGLISGHDTHIAYQRMRSIEKNLGRESEEEVE